MERKSRKARWSALALSTGLVLTATGVATPAQAAEKKLTIGFVVHVIGNPFINQINLDFNIKGYLRLNVDVFELTTGNRVFSRQGLQAGTPIILNELLSGTYIIKITSNDSKIVQQFKMLKM